jgi:hypothetical protein
VSAANGREPNLLLTPHSSRLTPLLRHKRLTLPQMRVSLLCRRISGGSSFRSALPRKRRFHLTTNGRPDYLSFLFMLKIFTHNKIA